jgi:superfamily II DNA or RNA helicase
MCGEPLPVRWHSDHIIPFWISGRTNVHEMQALCPACNRKKGGSMSWGLTPSFQYRQHQGDLDRACKKIQAGQPIQQIIPIVTPGGGKSYFPVILAHRLIPSFADKICWIAPRMTLLEQAEGNFLDTEFRQFLRHSHSIRASTNELDPSRGLAGYVTTYQAIAADSCKINVREFERSRYILVLDECHHVEEGGIWHRAIQPLVDRAKLLVTMTGSLNRGDRQRIAFLPYRQSPGGLKLDLDSTETIEIIRYTRQDALREQAKIPLLFRHADAQIEYVSRTGEEKKYDSFEDVTERHSDALWTALETGFALALLNRGIADWVAFKAFNPRSKCLIVAPNQRLARFYFDHLKEQHPDLKVKIAISDDGDEAVKAIRSFKRQRKDGSVDVLITVAMAYEGMDVKSITHIICLTHIRSASWIEQMLDRATRYDREAGPWSVQTAYAYVPDDYLMREIIKQIKAEQVAVVPDLEGRICGPGGGGSAPPKGSINPLASNVTRERCTDLVGDDQLGYDETRQIQEEMDRQRIAGPNPLQIKRLMVALGFAEPPDGAAVASLSEPLLTPSQRETNLLNSIQKYCSTVDRRQGWEHGEANRLVVKRFGKKRPHMTIDELREVWAWLQESYPLD